MESKWRNFAALTCFFKRKAKFWILHCFLPFPSCTHLTEHPFVSFNSITKLSKICKSSTLIARDAVRIPSSVNELGEYMTGSSDYLREAAGNAVTAYTFSCLEQYIPLCLIETVRVIGSGEGIILKSPLTMNGIEALDRSGSVLYRDLKGATSFDNSFWDVELAAVSFERSASLIAMMELEME